MENNTSKSVDEIVLAYQILKTTGHPLHYRELIDRVVAAKSGATRPPAYVIADIHTRINLDSRFVHTGKSMWGLNEWSPQRISLREVEESATARTNDIGVRREKLLAAIQQDFEPEDGAVHTEPAALLEDEDELEEDEDELEGEDYK
ncbi:DNA-directed RNA polymerase subunit delta [Sporomusa sphaeroides]|uniref:DNA-directed RNA polymerase subunit delta n=1 Tax=Sporomusa sphaeroides TaxID=47679 RepID=UPI002B9A13BA|nr:DNA-directed RNA polymerase subunit delta [Sporomusa sphaeroides]HML32732.1 DNA-directed RNA polymerase subunit delta [Sporomusa sphaeroides]